MKLYNYLAFSIYSIFSRIKKKDSHSKLVFTTSLILTLIIVIIIFCLKMISELKGFNDDLFSGFYIFIFMTIIWLPNYLYLRKEKFLNSYFYYNYRNVVFFVGVIFIVLSFFIIIANKNRERIFKERGYSQEVIGNGGKEPFDPNKKPDSFEGEVRLWYYDVFEK